MGDDREQVIEFLDSLCGSRIWADEGVAEALLGMLHELTAPWAQVDRSAMREVVDALDPSLSGWLSAGISLRDIPLWTSYGFTPASAQRWTDSGLDTHTMILWAKWGNVSGLDPQVVSGWERSIYGTSRTDDLQRRDIIGWAALGIPSDPGLVWWDAGWSWYDAQLTKQWMNAFPECEEPAALLVSMSNGRSTTEVERWYRHGVHGADLEAFERKGWGPEEAGEALRAGLSAQDVEVRETDLVRHADLLFGGDWERLHAVARQHEWSVGKVSPDGPNGCRVWFTRSDLAFEPRITLRNGNFFDGQIAWMFEDGAVTTAEFDLSLNDIVDALSLREDKHFNRR